MYCLEVCDLEDSVPRFEEVGALQNLRPVGPEPSTVHALLFLSVAVLDLPGVAL